VAQTISCTQCGTKFAITRDRCPKCRSFVQKVDKAAEAQKSRTMARVAAIVVGVFALAVTGLRIMQPSQPQPGRRTSAPVDPFAARRQAAAETKMAEENAPPAQPAQRTFMDSAASGAASYDSGDYAGALTRFEEAIKKNPQDAESFSNLGQVLVKQGRVADALPYFDKAIALDPKRWAYRFNQARALGLLERWEESIASYKQAQDLFPNDYVTTFNLGLALHKKGDEPAAIEEYKKAIALNPSEPSFRMAIAMSFERMQNKQAAVAEYTEYLRLSPTAADAEKVRSKIAQLTGQPAATGN
jgi:tetratricopeptide (TPR) repeat protein